MSNAQLAGITHFKETGSLFEGGATIPPLVTALVKYSLSFRVLCNLTCICLHACPLQASHSLFVHWNKRMDAQLRQPLFVTAEPCRHPIKRPAMKTSHTAPSRLLLPTVYQSWKRSGRQNTATMTTATFWGKVWETYRRSEECSPGCSHMTGSRDTETIPETLSALNVSSAPETPRPRAFFVHYPPVFQGPAPQPIAVYFPVSL